ncbi:hypothetical protein GGS23DRAFT_326435 [Durotheca rogersii]|uniref:uncharacterized protein n=1 Tax=Durotheca rogersii TaxID=419775 RepID=UPI00221F10BB|nr:uncharacterized protein GGS23DRAFT_326435 [Durotheca rogersii]KAI5859244.1 hypothetical protein GGS23DRAFT_326435 [Durotheca rogersii]
MAEAILGRRAAPSTHLASLGLDSLGAIEYSCLIRRLGIFVSPVEILDATAVRELHRLVVGRRDIVKPLDHIRSSADDRVRTPLRPDDAMPPHLEDAERIEICTPLQESMVAETYKDARLYVNRVELLFPSHISANAIVSWFSILAQRNENLRAGFVYVGHHLRQVVWKQLRDEQMEVVSQATQSLECVNVEVFLRHPFKAEIILDNSPSHHTVRLTLHHAIYDGWTMDLMLEDLSLLARGQPPIERPQFRQITQHLSTSMEGRLMDAKEFWAEKLQDWVPAPFPNFKTVAVFNPEITSISREIQVNPRQARDFALSSSIGPQVVFQACLVWLWGAVNGVQDTLIGSVSSGRTRPVAGIEKIMGPCMSTLPLRINLKQYKTIADLLQGIHLYNREALRHDTLPLVGMKRVAGVPHGQKLFELIFAYQETLYSRKKNNDTIRELWHRDSVEAKLLVEISPLDDRFSCQLTWHSDAFSESQVDSLFGHLECLVNYFFQNGEKELESISRCFPTASLSHYNQNPKPQEVLPSLAALVERTVTRFPTYDALCFATSTTAANSQGCTLTYRELNARANQIARYLRESGAVPGSVIALVMEKSPLLYCTILGIVKAGCAYLPVLPTTPFERILLILEQAQPQLCLVDDTSPRQISEAVINLERYTLLHDYPDSDVEVPDADPSHLAYVIYTSGTTGTPKGVSVTNANLLSNIEVLSRIYPHNPSDRMLQACSQAFDVSVFEIFFSWGNGMCLCAATNDTLFEDIEKALQTMKITHLSMTVTVASLVEPDRVPTVKFLVTSGEPMTDKVLERWADQLWQGKRDKKISSEGNSNIRNVGYGPSETTNICTVRKVARQDSCQYLGWPFENTSAFVFSPSTEELVPLGCVGELCFGGDQVAAGYLGMPEATAAKFFEHHEYGRLYRSGDVGRMLPDGSLIILGRMDTQVKLRGQRIELGEIQATVLKSGFANACASLLVTLEGSSSQQLALFYVPLTQMSLRFSILPLTTSTRQTVMELHQTLHAALPAYMVPSFILPISSLPMTSSGKVNYGLLRRAITEVSAEVLSICSSAQDLADQDSLEWTESEILISKAISETFNLDTKVVRRWSSFASLGIDSVSAMALARRLQALFRKRIPLSLILQNPTVGRLAIAINSDAAPPVTEVNATLLPTSLVDTVLARFATDWGEKGVGTVLPCTPLQEAMLSVPQSSNVETSYCNQMVFQLRMSSSIISRHWDRMFERHGILRTCFVTTEDPRFPFVQVVLEKPHFPLWQTFDVDDASFQEHILNHKMSLPVPVDSGKPPVSLALFSLGGSTEYMSFVCHHAIYDGVSARSLLAEVEAAVRHEPLPIMPTFDSFLRESLPLVAGADDFWAEQFRSFSPSRLGQRSYSHDTNPRMVSAKLSTHSLSSLTAGLRDLGVALLPLFQGAWAVTLSLFQQTKDVCFGNVVSGRSISLEQVDKLIAPCFNTVPIRMNLSHANFFLEVVKKFQHLNTEMIPYQFSSIRHIQSSLQLSTLFDTVLLLQPPPEPLDETIWTLELEQGAMDVPLVCEITPLKHKDAVLLQLHRNPLIVSYQTSGFILSLFQHVLNTYLDHPSSHIISTSQLPTQWQREIVQMSVSHDTIRETAHTALGPPGEKWTDAERKVRSVLSRLVNVPEERIGRHTPIYRYGLDSIGAVQFATLLRRESCPVAAVDVIQNPTCAGIASQLTSRGGREVAPAYDFDSFRNAVAGDLLTKIYEAILPCTSSQQGMISRFLNSGGADYFNYISWSLDAEISLEKLATAWRQLAARHQILRTGFATVNHRDSSYAMVVYPEADFAPPVSICQSNSFDILEWRAGASSKAFSELLSQPPWQVLLLDDGFGQRSMHLGIHHALYDAVSLHRLLCDLAETLSGTVGEKVQPVLPVLSAQLDTTHCQSASEAFWKGKAENFVFNKFPTMTPLRVVSGVVLTTSRLCDANRQIIRRHASEADMTVRAALQAAWTRVLSVYLGERSVTFGIVLDRRTTDDERRVIFPTVATLPIIAQNLESNAELLKYMMQYNTSLRQYEGTPLPQIQRWFGRLDHQIFDTILAYHAVPETEPMPWEVISELASVEYAVALEVVETATGRLKLNMTHNTDTLPAEQAHIMLCQFEAVLMNLLEFPRGHVDELADCIPDLFSIIPATHEYLPSPVGLLHQLVEQTAQRTPTATALEFVEELGETVRRRSWTYQELNEMGDRVANMLLESNTPPGNIVATCFNKCPEAYFSILGVLKAGCAFLSLDPGAPVSRLEFILSDSTAACLLTEDSSLILNSTIPMHVVDERNLLDSSAPFSTRPSISPSDTCYCLYTSGTTGTPKGCLISHDNAVQSMLAFRQLFSGHWDSHSRWLQFASFHFDVSVLEQYWSWFVGITVVSAPKDLILSDITATISKLDITHVDLTPSLARLIHPDEVPSLCKGVFITGGEQLREEILQIWGPKEVIYNAYGPTEATIGVTMLQRVPHNGRSSNIGTQFPNVGTYVLQPGTEAPVLRGGVGELCVSGRLVGKGYLNRKRLTEERFPTLRQHDERIYRTGDFVRILYDNSFDFLGRIDDQVKLRGQRLEIGEINHAIKTSLPHQLADVVTSVVRRTGQDRDLLVSFIAPITSPSTDLRICLETELCQAALKACKARLPGYMVPTYVLCVSFIPLSTNNKADVKLLKQLFADLSHQRLREFTAGSAGIDRALSEAEQFISTAISTVTQIPDVDVTPSSSIFELGIDSINVARLALILRSQSFPSASPSVILRHPQISSLSRALQQGGTFTTIRHVLQAQQSIRAIYHRHISMACITLGIDKDDVEYIAPCTPLQEGMITRSTASGTLTAYFNQFQVDLNTWVSVTRLKECWDSIFAQFALLRTAFLPTSDGHIQVAFKQKSLRWFEMGQKGDEIDTFASDRRERWILSNRETLRYPMEIDHVEYGEKHVLLIRLFHAVYDGRSFELLLRTVNSKYRHELPPSGPAFIEVLPHGPLLRYGGSRPFWERRFKGWKFQPLPIPAGQSGVSETTVSRVLQIEGLETRRVALQVTHQALLQAVWMVTLHQHFGFVPTIGIIFSGRSLALDGVENSIGPIFNTLPFRVEISRHKTWSSLIAEVQEHNASVLEFVHTPLRDIQKWCSKGQPLFDSLFVFEREDPLAVGDTNPFWSSIQSIGVADYPFALEVTLLRDKSLKINALSRQNGSPITNILLDEFARLLIALACSNNTTSLPKERIQSGAPTPARQESHDFTRAEGVSTYELVKTKHGREIQREVASLAGLPDGDISGTSNFLELGLDSIDLIKLVARLKRLGLHITIGELLKAPTIKSVLLSNERVHTSSPRNAVGATGLEVSNVLLRDALKQDGMELAQVTTVLPPTPLQESMVAEMLLSGFRRYFNHDVLEISPDVDVDRLQLAWKTVYANSPILRTTFAEIHSPQIGAAFCQIVRDEPLTFNPAVELPSLDQVATVIDHARNRALAKNGMADLFQLTFATTPENRYLVLSIAHALYDGWSLDLLHKDVNAAYEGHYHARSEYETFLSRVLLNTATIGERFWADFLTDARSTILDPDVNLSENEEVIHRAELVSVLSREEMKALCRKYRITPQVLAQGCWAPVLASLSRCLDVVFGVVLSGRDTDESRGLLFPTMNTVPLRVVLHGDTTEYFSYLQATMSDIIEHQHYPLRKAQRLAQFQGGKLFNTLFLLQNVKDDEMAHNSILHSVDASSAVEYPICVEMDITESSITWRIAGDGRYVSAQDARRILADIDEVLRYFGSSHGADILEFDPLSDKVTVCGLGPFELISNKSDGRMKTSFSPPQAQSPITGSPVIEVLSELSGVDAHSIDPDSTIYHLGLDSISAIKASSMLRKRGFEVSVRDLLKAGSIRDIFHRPSKDIAPPDMPFHFLPGIDHAKLCQIAGVGEAEVEIVLPALPMQVYMLSAWQNTDGLLFFSRFYYRLPRAMSSEKIASAWSRLVDENPILRTYFASTGSVNVPFAQIVAKPKTIYATKEFLHDEGKSVRQVSTPFASIQVEIEAEETCMQLYLHHALYDGVSLPVMLNRFMELCDGTPTPPIGLRTSTWYEFVLKHASPYVRQRRQQFWTSYLQKIITIRPPPQTESTPNPEIIAQHSYLKRKAFSNISSLKNISSTHGTTLQALFFAAYARVYAESLRRDDACHDRADVVFGVYLANRSNVIGLEEAPLPTLNIVPLVVRRPLDRPLATLAIEIQKDLVEISSFDHASVYLWEIFDWTGIQVETIVNFLAPQDLSTPRASLGPNMLESTGPESTTLPQHLAQPNADFVSQNKVKQAYIHTLDIEVQVRGNTVDIGAFGPSPHFSKSQIRDVVENLAAALEAAQ